MTTDIRPSEYGRRGIVGVGVPQANPTVEQEAFALRPPGMSIVTSRLTSCDADPKTRIAEYFTETLKFAGQFDDLTIDAFGIACTGSSYLVGLAEEQKLSADFSAQLGYRVITAAEAIARTMRKLGATRLSMVSPYPDWLAELAVAYWNDAGFEIPEIKRVPLSSENLHSIYMLGSNDALELARELDFTATDAILFSGTGMPSLGAINRLHEQSNLPVMSSNLCLLTALAEHLHITDAPLLTIADDFEPTDL